MMNDQHLPKINAALEESRKRYREANRLSMEQHRRAAQVLPGGNTRTVLFSEPFPITLKSAKGCYVTSLDGRTYVDYLCEFTAGLYGHSDPILKASVSAALENGWVRGGQIQQEEEFARLICARFPSMQKLRFANSGTEANLFAISAARAVSGKSKVMVFEGAYHGGVLTFGPVPSPLTVPFDYVKAPYNDWAATQALLEANADSLACVIIEPMQGSGGCIPAEPEFLKALRSWTAARGVILIFDEVMTSRLGTGGGLQGLRSVLPDMTTFGKYMGGGFSFGAFGGREDIMDRFNPQNAGYLAHAGTFNNNVFTMSAGCAGLKKVFTPDAARELTARGDHLRERLNKACANAPFPIQFTGLGSMMNVHMQAGTIKSIRDLQGSNLPLRDLLYFDLLEEGIWPARRGMINLSLPMGETEFDKLAHAVDNFLHKRKDLFA